MKFKRTKQCDKCPWRVDVLVQIGDVRYDAHGSFEILAISGVWLMVRRPGAMPGIKHRNEWLALSAAPIGPVKLTAKGDSV